MMDSEEEVMLQEANTDLKEVNSMVTEKIPGETSEVAIGVITEEEEATGETEA